MQGMVGTEFKMFVSLFFLNSMFERKLCNLLESAKLSPNLDWGDPGVQRGLLKGALRALPRSTLSDIPPKYVTNTNTRTHTKYIQITTWPNWTKCAKLSLKGGAERFANTNSRTKYTQISTWPNWTKCAKRSLKSCAVTSIRYSSIVYLFICICICICICIFVSKKVSSGGLPWSPLSDFKKKICN